MLLFTLAVLAVALTCTMFVSRDMLLGFPCVIFWGIFGGHCYAQHIVVWDFYYTLSFSGFGMAIFSAIAMYALRQRDIEPKEQDYEDSEMFIDETATKEGKTAEEENAEPRESRHVAAVHGRAERRRSRGIKRFRPPWDKVE